MIKSSNTLEGAFRVTMESGKTARFGIFEVDLRTFELRKAGIRIRVQSQPMQVLTALISKPGELVTREELQRLLWPGVASFDFEHGLNMAVKKLRAALSDSAETPRFIETLPRQGYRFIAPVQLDAPQEVATPSPSPAWPSRKKWLLVLGSIACISLASLAAMLRPAQPSARMITPLFSGTGFMRQLCFSPDGATLAFSWRMEGAPYKIFLKTTGLAEARRLTDDSDPNHSEQRPAWVPGGRGISYIRQDKDQIALFLAPITGGTPRKLVDIGRNDGYSWAPNGQELAVSLPMTGDRHAIYSLSLDGTKRQLSRPSSSLPNDRPDRGGDGAPRYSPDGRWIAFVRFLSDAESLMVMPAGGGESVEVTRYRLRARGFSWSADSREIFYSVSPEEAPMSFYRVQVPHGKPEPLSFGITGTEAFEPTAAPSGNRLAYLIGSSQFGIWRYELPHAKASPGPPVRIVADGGAPVGPAFSPDGRRIAFSSNRTGHWEIWTCDDDGQHLLQLTAFNNGDTGSPRWSPDGRRICFDARPQGKAEVYVIDVEGGTPRLLTPGEGDAQIPEWSPDGLSIYYTRIAADGTSDIWKVAVAGGESKRITTNNSYGAFPSPDGKQLYIGKRFQQSIFSIPVSGGTEMKILESAPRGARALGASGIYFLASKPGTAQVQLMRYSFDHHVVESLLAVQRHAVTPALAIAPDETTALISHQYDFVFKVMLVENFR